MSSSLSRESKKWVLLSAILYTGAKLFEWIDYSIYAHFAQIISGHTLKHILGAASTACYLRVLPELANGNRKTRDQIFGRNVLIVFFALLVGVVGFLVYCRQTDTLVSKGFFWPWPILSQSDIPKNVERVTIRNGGGPALDAWWIQGARTKNSKNLPVILFLHGNAGNLSIQYSQFAYLSDWGYDVLALDYRGFGFSEGHPTREGMLEDSTMALAYLQERAKGRKIAVVGHSMGTVFAMQLAALDPRVDRVVILASFTRFSEIAEWVLRQWGTSAFTSHVIDRSVIRESLDQMTAAETSHLPPALFVHGTDDRVVPYAMGEKVFKTYQGVKSFLKMDGYGHQDFHQGAQAEIYKRSINHFLGNRAI